MRQYLLNGSNYGKLILLIGLLIGIPLIVLPFYPAEIHYMPAFLIPMLLSMLLGFAICAGTHRHNETVSEWQSPLKRGSLIILFAWFYSFLMGAVPLVISGKLNFIHALFESVSGWTTAGLTVLNVTEMPRIILFYRVFMQYCGGLGFILMMVTVIQGKHSMTLYNAEGHIDRIMPSLKQTSRVILSIYTGFLIIGASLYRFFGMELFDAVCHAMSAISTAGFTTKANGIGEYGSLAIEIITVILMLAGASNFAILLLLTEGKMRRLFRVTEMRFMIGLLAVFVPLMTCSLATELNMGIGESLRHALFGVVTTFSTTGYSIMDYPSWPPFSLGLLILLMFIGGSAGSTSGGIKLLRTYLLLRISYENIRKRLSPANKITAPSYSTARGKAPIDNALIADTFEFVVCYIGVFIIGTLLITVTAGCSLYDAMLEFLAAFSTIGISRGITKADTNTATLIVEMAGMTLGRLEIFVVFFGFLSGVQLIKKRLRRKTL